MKLSKYNPICPECNDDLIGIDAGISNCGSCGTKINISIRESSIGDHKIYKTEKLTIAKMNNIDKNNSSRGIITIDKESMDILGITKNDLTIEISDVLNDLFKCRISVSDAADILKLTKDEINELIDNYDYIPDYEDIKNANLIIDEISKSVRCSDTYLSILKKFGNISKETKSYINDKCPNSIMQIEKKQMGSCDISTDEIIKQKNDCIFANSNGCIGDSGEVKCLFCNKCVLNFEDACELIKLERNNDSDNVTKREMRLNDKKQMKFNLDGEFELVIEKDESNLNIDE